MAEDPLSISPDKLAIGSAQLPFAEQIAFFRSKMGNLIPTATWRDVMLSGHDSGFMVAGAMKADLLAELAALVDQSIAEGKGIEWFRQNFDDIVARAGWAYNGERNWRTRVIYQTNLSTSYAAGRLAQLRSPDLRKAAPLWMYKHTDGESHPRPLHESWDGLTLPADDPWWSDHYPPNGWGCQCYVIAVSKGTAERLGGRIEDPPDDGTYTTKDGTELPNGIDQGWNYAPGDTVSQQIQDSILQKLSNLPDAIASGLRNDLGSRK